ncbi:hypothetical protein LINPERPRIM_LOCUS305 [Linum perenne]
MADLNEDCGIPARASYDTMKKAVGGAENLGFTHTDLKNHIRTRRTRAIENGDVSVLLNHFSSEQTANLATSMKCKLIVKIKLQVYFGLMVKYAWITNTLATASALTLHTEPTENAVHQVIQFS